MNPEHKPEEAWISQDNSQNWQEFRKRYFIELDENRDTVNERLNHIQQTKVVFLFSAKEIHDNNAVALKDYIHSLLAQ